VHNLMHMQHDVIMNIKHAGYRSLILYCWNEHIHFSITENNFPVS